MDRPKAPPPMIAIEVDFERGPIFHVLFTNSIIVNQEGLYTYLVCIACRGMMAGTVAGDLELVIRDREGAR